MARYDRLSDELDEGDTDVDIMYFSEACTDTQLDTDSEHGASQRAHRSMSLPLRTNSHGHNARPPGNKRLCVMFMRARRQGMRAALSVRDYLVNDVLPFATNCEYVHAELVFSDENLVDSHGQRVTHTTLTSAMNLGGVTWVDNKLYLPDEYPVVFEIEVNAGKYDNVKRFAQTFLVAKQYDTTYFYCFCCIGLLGMHCRDAERVNRYTCTSLLAAMLAAIGIGDATGRDRLHNDKNITADQLFHIMTTAYEGLCPISANIDCIRLLEGPPERLRLVTKKQVPPD